MQRLMALGLIACGFAMIAAGLWHFETVQVGHIIFGVLAMTAGFYCLVFTEPFHEWFDEKSRRHYRFVKQSENPHHAKCPRCSRESPMIIATQGNPKHLKGVKCGWCGEVWFDLEEKS